MARGPVEHLAAVLWRVAGEADLAHLGDAELLDRYVACGDERAFRALVGRHAPLVWEVCTRSLRSHQDAEDAFQATFIALARRVRDGTRIAVLPAWLREVAWRAARDIRLSAARRREVHVESMSDAPSRAPGDPRELAEILDEEVRRLPDDLRRPFELCRFQDRTYAEAARLLGCSVATVCRRVEQAATALRGRLAGQGLMPAGGTVGAVLALSTAAQSVPPGLAARAADVALASGAGGSVPAVLVATAEAALRAGSVGPLKLVGAVVLAVAGLAGGVALVAGMRPAGPADAPAPVPRPVEPPARDAQPLPPGAVARIVTTRFPAGRGPTAARGSDPGVMSVAFSAHGRTVATVTPSLGTASLRLWDAATGAPVATAALPADLSPGTVQPAGTGFAITETSPSGAVRWAKWDGTAGTRVTAARWDGARVAAVAPDGRTAVAAFDDRLVLIDPATGAERDRLADAPAGVDNLVFTPYGNTLIAHGGPPGGRFATWVRAADRWQAPAAGAGTNFHTGRILSLSPDGRFAAVPCDSRFADPILVHDLARNGSVAGWLEAGGEPLALVFSPDSRAVAATGGAGGVRVWEVASGRLRREFAGHAGKILSVAFSPDGNRLVSGGADDTAFVWDLAAPFRPAPADDELVRTLGGADAAAAYDVVLTLAGRPADAARLLRPHLLPPKAAEADVARWIGELAEPDSPARRDAVAELERHGRTVEAALRRSLAAAPPEPARVELYRLTERLDGSRSPHRLTEARGLEALERAGTPAAKELLAAVAAAHPDTLAALDATAAIRRMTARTAGQR